MCHHSIHVFRDWENNFNRNVNSYNRNTDCNSPALYGVRWAWGNSWSNMKMKWLDHAYKISFDCWICNTSVTVIHLISLIISDTLLLSLQKKNVFKKMQYHYFPTWLSSPKVVKLFFSNMKGDLIPHTSSSVTTGKVLADRWVTVLDVSPSHCLTHQVNLLWVDLKFLDASNESPRSFCTPVMHLPVRRNIPKKYGP